MKKFNYDCQIPEKVTQKYEKYFEYRWARDLLMAVTDHEDIMIMEQLPFEVMFRVFTEYLFKNFLNHFKRTFLVTKSK